MAQHIDKVEYYHVQIILHQLRKLGDKAFTGRCIVYFMIRKSMLTAIPVEAGSYQWSFIQILAFFFVLVHPQIRKHTRYLIGHESGKYRITCILRGRRQNTEIELFFESEKFRQLAGYNTPLVITEVVEHKETDFLPLVEQRKNTAFHQVRTHHWGLLRNIPFACGIHCFHPVKVVSLDEFGKGGIGLCLLHGQHFAHGAVACFQLQFPIDETAIELYPVVGSQ